MSAKKASRTVLDWAKVKAILSPQDFAVVNEQRARHTELTRILATPIPKIDLAQYKAVLENQKVASEVESSLQAFRPAKADPAPVLKSLDDQQVQAVQQAKQTVQKVQQAVSTFKTDLEGIKNLKHFDHLLPEDVYESTPGLEKVYHDRLRQGKVYHDDHNFGEKFFG